MDLTNQIWVLNVYYVIVLITFNKCTKKRKNALAKIRLWSDSFTLKLEDLFVIRLR